MEQEGEDYGYGEFIKTIDTVIMGRKTYEKVVIIGMLHKLFCKIYKKAKKII